ncbi:MAG: exodeoxyribonuclease VII small subunit [Coriobacteriia bacterium]|nr:exodeoxyribonuclease VII small subunit [Coriobacteriia bacterium]
MAKAKPKAPEYETYEEAKERLDQIVSDVRGKDISLEASLDLLDEGVELANRCTELIDVASWSRPSDVGDGESATENDGVVESDTEPPCAPSVEPDVNTDGETIDEASLEQAYLDDAIEQTDGEEVE